GSRCRTRPLGKEPRCFSRVSLQWMARVPAPEVEPEVQRKEREPDPLVLREVPQLMAPDRRRRLARGDDDVTERDRREAPSRQHAAISLRQVRHMSSVISTVISPSEADATMTAPGSAEVSVAAAGPAPGAAGLPQATTTASTSADSKRPGRIGVIVRPGPKRPSGT